MTHLMDLMMNRWSIDLISGDFSLVCAPDNCNHRRCAHACCHSHGHNADICDGGVDWVPGQGSGEGNGRSAGERSVRPQAFLPPRLG